MRRRDTARLACTRRRVPQTPNGVLGVAKVLVSVKDLQTSILRYQQLLGPALSAELGPGLARLPIEGCVIELRHHPDAPEGPIGYELKSR